MFIFISVCKKIQIEHGGFEKVILWHCIHYFHYMVDLLLFTTWLLVVDFSWPAGNVPILSHRTESACYSATVTPS